MIYKAIKLIRRALMKWPTEVLYFPLVAKTYPSWAICLQQEQLSAMPEGSLGNCLLNFITKNNLPLTKGAELHDAKHVLLNYGIEFEDEIKMQYFELGNGNHSLPVWIVIIAGTLLAPEFIPEFSAAYNRGKSNRPLTTGFLIENITSDLVQLKNNLIL